MMKGCKVDFCNNSVVVTKAFETAMADPSSKEFKYIVKLRKDFPTMEIVHKKSKTSAKSSRNKNLTYGNMEHFICSLPNHDAYLTEFNFLRYDAKVTKSRYFTVKNWFEAQFPQYNSDPLFYLYQAMDRVPAEAVIEDENAA